MDYAIGVDIGGSKIAVGLVNGNKILKKKIIKTPQAKKDLLDAITDAIGAVYDKRISGIGVGVAGGIDAKGNWIHSPNIPCVKNIPLKKLIQKKYKKRVEINNDANCFALEEAIIGQGKGKTNVFGLILGTGTGGGIVINQKIVTGKDFLAGEIGAIPFKGKHAEEFCSGRYIKALARKHKLKPDAYYISDQAKKGNKKAKQIYKEFGENVGQLLGIIINVLNPDIIVIGGGVSNNYKFFRISMLSSMRKHLFFKRNHKTPVKKALKKDYGILGASMLLKTTQK